MLSKAAFEWFFATLLADFIKNVDSTREKWIFYQFFISTVLCFVNALTIIKVISRMNLWVRNYFVVSIFKHEC